MNRTMTKNICLVAAFFITAILAVLMMGNNAGATASAASAEFELYSRVITDLSSEDGLSQSELSRIDVGDYAVDVYLKVDGTMSGIQAAFQMNYDNVNFETIYANDVEDDYLYRPLRSGAFAVANEPELGVLSAVCALPSGTIKSGYFMTIYFEKKTDVDSDNPVTDFIVVELEDGGGNPVPCPSPTYVSVVYPYILGDLNGDGIADADDASLLLACLEDSNTISITELTWVLYDDNFPATVICFEQVDANQDGYIMENDADEILSAYASGMFGNYTGDIGTEKVYYVTVNI